MSRRTGRKQAFQILYGSDVTRSGTAEAVKRWRSYRGDPDPYAVRLCYGIEKNAEEIDAVISKVAVGWPIGRMNAVDRTVLRIGVFEMSHAGDVPAHVAITEAVELAKGFSSDEAPTFVGGVLRGAESYLASEASESGGDKDPAEPPGKKVSHG
ncbi:transcription antitermination factor NusB [Rubrobacter indicoceani]|uniref:transcription antitermination factor NusB n=1 Tax=Rubrobacter indicoceani TaxID=2051957 RepID=UPI0013C466D8|nr:transcription antitermination factor NusB [Rubrobacter indicoceani]